MGGMAGGLAAAVQGPDDEGAMLREVLEGLRLADKRIPSKYHYDARGSELFEEITRLEEYYPTRTERALLRRWMPTWVDDLRPATLVELGAGNADKTRVILDAMVRTGAGKCYVPLDVSDAFLRETARSLREAYPTLEIRPVVADITGRLDLPPSPAPAWLAFLGSTIGNFERDGAVSLLGRIRRELRPADRFLLGIDLRPGPNKSVERIERAYDDAAGVTAAFSLNVLAVLNSELGADFDLEGFRHDSFYDIEKGRIETYLVSVRDQTVRFMDGSEVGLRAGERVRTEVSAKYDRVTIDGMFADADLDVVRWVEDDQGLYALVLGRGAG
jgi:L-histidine N-alpha-methyltransferase